MSGKAQAQYMHGARLGAGVRRGQRSSTFVPARARRCEGSCGRQRGGAGALEECV